MMLTNRKRHIHDDQAIMPYYPIACNTNYNFVAPDEFTYKRFKNAYPDENINTMQTKMASASFVKKDWKWLMQAQRSNRNLSSTSSERMEMEVESCPVQCWRCLQSYGSSNSIGHCTYCSRQVCYANCLQQCAVCSNAYCALCCSIDYSGPFELRLCVQCLLGRS